MDTPPPPSPPPANQDDDVVPPELLRIIEGLARRNARLDYAAHRRARENAA